MAQFMVGCGIGLLFVAVPTLYLLRRVLRQMERMIEDLDAEPSGPVTRRRCL